MQPLLFTLSFGLLVGLASPKEKPGDPAKGKVVFQQCSGCHNPDSTRQKMGSGLKGLFKKAKLQNGRKATEQAIRARIDAGGNGMPPFQEMLTDQEKDDLVAYLKTL